ncbi:MAG: crossover junction endodeoxyribonuclease RuvC [Patescibacteria group bacterium]|nr:crossover junction endodeoxyribonuclease RuvC [Patescibacteria group bacterium]
MIILGIDPGLATTGYAVVNKDGSKFEMIDYGCILTKKGEKLESRLFEISEKLKIIIEEYKPEKVAIEQLFFCKNVKTAMVVGQARGAVLLTATKRNLSVYEYTPLQIKQAVSGYGKADKQQVQKMVQIIFNLKEIPKPDDAADALAIAYTCGVSLTSLTNFEK